MNSITSLAAGRIFRDAVPDGDDFRLRFADGLEIRVAWASNGPEVKDFRFGVITGETVLHPQFRYVAGKTVKHVLTDGTQLTLVFIDGHELRSDFKRAPHVEAVDVRIPLPAVSGAGFIAVL